MPIATKDIAANGTHPAKIKSLIKVDGYCDLSAVYEVRTSWFKAGTDQVVTIVEPFRSYSEAKNWFDFA